MIKIGIKYGLNSDGMIATHHLELQENFLRSRATIGDRELLGLNIAMVLEPTHRIFQSLFDGGLG